MTKEDLIAGIRHSFANRVYPGDLSLVYNNTGDHLECEEVREEFRGKTWESLSHAFLLAQRYSLSFFSHEAFNYYLPAFLIFVVEDFYNADDLSDNLLLKLTLPAEIDVAIMAQSVKNYKIDQQMPDVDFDTLLRNQLYYKNQDIHNFIARVTQLTKDQGQAVFNYLNYLKQAYADEFSAGELDKATDRYWFIFAS